MAGRVVMSRGLWAETGQRCRCCLQQHLRDVGKWERRLLMQLLVGMMGVRGPVEFGSWPSSWEVQVQAVL